MSMSKQPSYNKSHHKFVSRKTNMDICYLLKNRRTLRNQCWTLCHYQDNSEGSEIVQYLNNDFISSPKQLFGVDNDKELIEKNEETHPEANWIHNDWYYAIRSNKFWNKRLQKWKSFNFNPEFIYLDTLLCLNNPAAARMLIDTMDLCPDGTVIVANFCSNNPRCGKTGSDLFDKTILLANMMKEAHPISLRKWNVDDNFNFPCISYLYSTSKTIMRSYIFYKGFVDSKKVIRELSKN